MVEQFVVSYEVRLGSQGRIVIPADLRAELGAEEGDVYVANVDAGGALVLRTREQALRELRRQWAATVQDSATDELLRERRLAAQE